MTELEITDLSQEEISFAAGLLGRAYRDNLMTFALLGNDPELRLRVTEGIMEIRIESMERRPLAARRDGEIVGVCGFEPPGGSDMSPENQRRMIETLSLGGPDVLRKAQTMRAEWAGLAPAERHWHLGPVGVEPGLQGKGIGSMMVERFCDRMDAEGELAYLETEHEENLRLYEKFGFVIIDQAPVLGIPMWRMIRRPAG